MIIGRNVVLEALHSKRPMNKVIISDQLNRRTEQEIKNAAKKADTIVQNVPRKKLDQMTNDKHQGIIAYVSAYHYFTVQEILQLAEEKQEPPFIMILDEIEDPHNLGAILRTADATGVHGVIIPKRRAVGLTSTVAKTSAGAMEYVPVVQVTNIARTIEELKKNYIWVVGTDAQGTDDYRTLDGETAIALVIGSEGRGISRLVKEKCDWTVSLPMTGAVSSLNASVAASLLMYEIYRKRNPIGET